MEPKTLEELRDSIALVIAMADVDYERRRDAERNLDSFIVTIQRQVETKCKEALATQSEVWAKECSRQVASAMECGRIEGAEETKATILRESMPVVGDFVHIPSVIVHVSVLAPEEKP